MQEFKNFGLLFTIVHSSDPAEFERAIQPNTKLLYIESPSNPLLNIIDISAIAQIGKKHNVLTMIDNTFASPVNQTPIDFGIDLVMHSGTKYLNGHSDVQCGMLAGRKEIIEKIAKQAHVYGGCLSSMECFWLERGMKTLALRVRQQNENATQLAKFLNAHPRVKKVYYPGLESHKNYEIAKKQMTGFGGMVSVDLNCESKDVSRFTKALRLATPAVSLGGMETILCLPCQTSHAALPREEREKIGISDTLVRISVGIEEIQDIINDFKQALEVL